MTEQMDLAFLDVSPEANAIMSFEDAHRFLSNFWLCFISVRGVTYNSVEHAYVASKTLLQEERELLLTMTPGQAKRYGRKITLRQDWGSVKLAVMQDLLRQKFVPGSELAGRLLATGDRLIVEGNSWGDTFWGVCRGKGENHLGKLLMQIREELSPKQADQLVMT